MKCNAVSLCSKGKMAILQIGHNIEDITRTLNPPKDRLKSCKCGTKGCNCILFLIQLKVSEERRQANEQRQSSVIQRLPWNS